MAFTIKFINNHLVPFACVALLAGACSDDGNADDASETTAASGTDTQSESSTTDETTEATTDDPTTTNDDASFIAETGPDTGVDTAAPGNLGDMCQDDGDCAEDLFCNGIPGFGGICSECGSDADCDGGNCTFGGGWFECGDGSVGQMCESDAACGDGLYCAELIDLGGFFPANFCSECSEDMHCQNGQLCAPEIDLASLPNINGQRACVDPGTLAQDSLCDHNGSGDEQCADFCTPASIMGFLEVGLCGECETDGDCQGQSTCMPAVIDIMSGGFSGSVCV